MSEALIINVNKDGSATAIAGTETMTFSEGTEKQNFMDAVKWGDKQMYGQKKENEKGDS